MSDETARYAARRTRVLSALGDDAVLVLTASPELRVGPDGELRYVVDASLYYLTGYTEPEAVLVLGPANGDAPFTLFVRARDEERERWTGARGGVEQAKERFGAHAAHSVEALGEKLPDLLAPTSTIYARLGAGRPEVDAVVLAVLERARRARPRTGKGPRTLVDPGVLLDEMRLVKDAAEIEAIRTSARITIETFREAARAIRSGTPEYVVEAALEAGFRRRGADGPAFPSIVASGPNAVVLHYITNERVMEAGELVLLDAGARNAVYCADLSRTFPVGGHFTADQRVLYDAVRAARDAGVAAAVAGATVDDVHIAAVRELLAGLVELGCLDGPVDALLEPEREREIRAFYPHRTSHWLGLDVHDVGDYVVDGRSRALEPGMVLTVEPGLYIPTSAVAPAAALRGTGIRIEDDVLITPEGNEVLTAALPVAAAAVEALME